MSRAQSADEVKREHLVTFGPPLGPLYHALWKEVVWLHVKWGEVRKLYASPEEPEKRIELLNETAGFFFGMVQNIVLDDVLLHLSRLTDQAEQGGNKNLTILGLPEAVGDPELRSKVCASVREARARTAFARQRRNRRIAHRDLPLALGETRAGSLSGASREDVEAALESIGDVMNLLSSEYGEGTVAYEPLLPWPGGVDALVRYLSLGSQADRERRRKGQSGHEDP